MDNYIKLAQILIPCFVPGLVTWWFSNIEANRESKFSIYIKSEEEKFVLKRKKQVIILISIWMNMQIVFFSKTIFSDVGDLCNIVNIIQQLTAISLGAGIGVIWLCYNKMTVENITYFDKKIRADQKKDIWKDEILRYIVEECVIVVLALLFTKNKERMLTIYNIYFFNTVIIEIEMIFQFLIYSYASIQLQYCTKAMHIKTRSDDKWFGKICNYKSNKSFLEVVFEENGETKQVIIPQSEIISIEKIIDTRKNIQLKKSKTNLKL